MAGELTDTALAGLDRFEQLARSRRTNLRMDVEQPVDPALVQRLCTLACWAPNHKLTQPWRFAVLTGAARARLGELAADHQQAEGDTDEARLTKTRAKYLRAPVVVIIASTDDTDVVRARENRYAVAAGVQNLLLAATAAGLNSYWGTGAVVAAPSVRRLAGFDDTDEIIAIVYLGWPLGPVPVPERAPAAINWRD